MKFQFLLAAALLTSAPAFATVTEDMVNIDKAEDACLNAPGGESNNGMKQCSWAAGDAYEKVLNEVYQNVVKLYPIDPKADAINADYSREGLKRLKASERAWLAYRDAQSNLDGMEMYQGSGESLIVSGSRNDITKTRILQLNGLLDFKN